MLTPSLVRVQDELGIGRLIGRRVKRGDELVTIVDAGIRGEGISAAVADQRETLVKGFRGCPEHAMA